MPGITVDNQQKRKPTVAQPSVRTEDEEPVAEAVETMKSEGLKKKKRDRAVVENAVEDVLPSEEVSGEPAPKKKKKKTKAPAVEEPTPEPETSAPAEEDLKRRKKKSKKADTTEAQDVADTAAAKPRNGKSTPAPSEPTSVTPEQAAEIRQSLGLTVSEPDCPAPVTTIDECNFPGDVVNALAVQNITKPSPIQAQCWPLALQGRDVVGLAETGSGKTLGFLLPAIVHLLARPRGKPGQGPVILVMAPTRELALQIEQVCVKAAAGDPRLRSVCAHGGVPKEPQAKALREGAAICIATPGRLIDLIESGCTSMRRVSFLVLDEADRMLDMGFEPQIRSVVTGMECKDRQTLMFSATWPKEVQKLANEFLRRPVTVNVGADRSDKLAANHHVKQVVEVCTEQDKKRKLLALLPKIFVQGDERILIFMLYKKNCDYLHRELVRAGWPVVCIHGDKRQAERDRVLADFRSGASRIVIATDVAARGWDVKDVRYVINYEFPLTVEDYVHRIGRTARAGASGTAYTYFTEENKEFAQDLVQILAEAKQPVPAELDAWKHIGYRRQRKTASTALYGTGNWTASVPTATKKHIKFDDDE